MATRTHKLFRSLDELLQGRNHDSRKIANNTYLTRLSDNMIALKLHATYIVKVERNGSVILSTGGWDTVTTRERMNAFLCQYRSLIGAAGDDAYRVYTNRGYTFLSIRNDALPVHTVRKIRVYRATYQGAYGACVPGSYNGQITREVRGNPHWREWDNALTIQFPGYEWQRDAETRRHARGQWNTPRAASGAYYPSAHKFTRTIRPSFHSFIRTETETTDTIGGYRTFPFFNGITISGRGRVSDPVPDKRRPYREVKDRRPLREKYTRATGPFFKVLKPDLRAPFVDTYHWTPGKWQTVKGPLVPCANGLHCATRDQLSRWVRVDDRAQYIDGRRVPLSVPILQCRVFKVDTRGPVWYADGKCFARTIRLGNELSAGDVFALANVNLPIV
jgi:hypothetical protein